MPDGTGFMVELTPENAKMFDAIMARKEQNKQIYGEAILSPADRDALKKITTPIEKGILKDSGGDYSRIAGATYYPEDSRLGTEGTGKFAYDLNDGRKFLGDIGGLEPDLATGQYTLPPHNTYGLAGIPNAISGLAQTAIDNPGASTLTASILGAGGAAIDRYMGEKQFGIAPPEGAKTQKTSMLGNPKVDKDGKPILKDMPNLTQGNFSKIAQTADPTLLASDIAEGSKSQLNALQTRLNSLPENLRQGIATANQYGLQTPIYPMQDGKKANALTPQQIEAGLRNQMPSSSYIANKISDYKERARMEVENIKKAGGARGMTQVKPGPGSPEVEKNKFSLKNPRTMAKTGGVLGLGLAGKMGYDYYKDQSTREGREVLLNMINQKRLANGQTPLTPEQAAKIEEKFDELKASGAF